MKQLIACKKLFLLTTFYLYSSFSGEAQNILPEPLDKKEENIQFDYNSKIKGAWRAIDDTFNSPFMLGDSTIFYPDSVLPEYKYQIQHDSLFIFYEDFISVSKISKATGDTLDLTSEGDKQVFIKSLR
ncbi:MAG: hypothetical protein SH857_13455 [Chitinophagales bacterium]|nr:hypothetical protein [Chitinophagales bacterium]